MLFFDLEYYLNGAPAAAAIALAFAREGADIAIGYWLVSLFGIRGSCTPCPFIPLCT